MKTINFHERRACRKRQNNDVIRRMREGDPLKSFGSLSSWYPPRPVIEKDKDALSKLYKIESKTQGKSAKITIVQDNSSENNITYLKSS